MLVRAIFAISAAYAAAVVGLVKSEATSINQVKTNIDDTKQLDRLSNVAELADSETELVKRQREKNPWKQRASYWITYKCPNEAETSRRFSLWGEWLPATRQAVYHAGTNINRVFDSKIRSSNPYHSSVGFMGRHCESKANQSCTYYIDGTFHAVISDEFDFTANTLGWKDYKDPTIRVNCNPGPSCTDGQQAMCQYVRGQYMFSSF